MPVIVHFEVYVYGPSGWTLHARYTGAERDQAIEDAKMVEFQLTRPVKVVRDTYYTESNYGEESTVYASRLRPETYLAAQAKKRKEQARVRQAASQAGAADPYAFTPSARSAPSGPKGAMDFTLRLTMVLVVSLVVASIITGLTSFLMEALVRQGLVLPGTTSSVILFLTFLGVFLLMAVSLMLAYVPLQDLGGSKAPSSSSFQPASSRPDARKPSWLERLFGLDGSDGNNKPPKTEMPPPPAPEPSPPKAEDTPAKDETEEDDLEMWPPQRQDDEEGDIPLPEDEAPQDTDEQAEAKEEPSEEEQKAADEKQAMEKAQGVIMRFLGGVMNAVRATHPTLDAYNHFGINLFISGACQALGENLKLSPKSRSKLLLEAVEVIGTRPEQGKRLIERLPTYVKETRYRQMIGAGRVSMELHLSNSADPFIAIGGLMKDWNKPQAMQVSSGTVTILFTDMVGSTDMTAQLGDKVMQDVIRSHNTIVRDALRDHRGKEIKHTGDGIMASFDAPGDAVDAAVQIQTRVIDHNQRWPRLPMALRVGMNTGEPIVEENDYFGATVQIAARICAVAGAGQIWLSDTTRDLVPSSKPYDFFNHGPRTLKGVGEPLTLYEVAVTEGRSEDFAKMRALGKAAISETAEVEDQPGEAPSQAAASLSGP